jgi:hypothetical protein
MAAMKTMDANTKYLWEGAVGIKISTRLNGVSKKPFYTFELVRCFKREGSDEMEYTRSFSPKNADAIGRVIQRALEYMHENPADAANDTPATPA